jgi:hypothetical protein
MFNFLGVFLLFNLIATDANNIVDSTNTTMQPPIFHNRSKFLIGLSDVDGLSKWNNMLKWRKEEEIDNLFEGKTKKVTV